MPSPTPSAASSSPSQFPFEFRLKPTRQPMLWAALAYAGRILAGTYLWRPPALWIAAVIAFVAAGFYFRRNRTWLAASLALMALFVAGALQLQLSGTANLRDTSLQPFTDGQQVD